MMAMLSVIWKTIRCTVAKDTMFMMMAMMREGASLNKRQRMIMFVMLANDIDHLIDIRDIRTIMAKI